MKKMSRYEKRVRERLQDCSGMYFTYPRQAGKRVALTKEKVSLATEAFKEPPSKTLVPVYRMEIIVDDGRGTQSHGIWNAGIYVPALESLTWKYKRELSGAIPEPQDEGIPFSTGMFCGILDHDEHLHTWLPWSDTWEALYAKGMRLHEYLVPENKLYIGKTQVCYWPQFAKFSKEIDFETFRLGPYERRRAARGTRSALPSESETAYKTTTGSITVTDRS